MRDSEPVMLTGESFVGEGAQAAHMVAVRAGVAAPPAVADVLAGREYQVNPYYPARPAALAASAPPGAPPAAPGAPPAASGAPVAPPAAPEGQLGAR